MVCAGRMASSGLGSVHIDIPSAVKVDRKRESCDAPQLRVVPRGEMGSPSERLDRAQDRLRRAGRLQLRLAAGLDRVRRVENRGIDGDAQHQRRLADRLGAVSGAR